MATDYTFNSGDYISPAPASTPVVATTSTAPSKSYIDFLRRYVTKPIPSVQELTAQYGNAGYAELLQKAMQDQQVSYKAEIAQYDGATQVPASTLSTAPVTAPATAPTPQPLQTPAPTFDFDSALKAQQAASTKSYADALAANQTALSKQNSDFLTNWNSSAATLKNDILAGVDAKNQAFGTEATKGFMGAFKNFQIPTNQQTGVNMGNYNDNRNAAADQWWSQYVTGRR